MVEIRRVTDEFSVAPQIRADDFAKIADAGFRHVINNRPDGEALGQLTSAEAERQAEAAGVTYHHAPFKGPPTEEAINALEALMDAAEGPMLAYCRSGTRSITAWAMMQGRKGNMSAAEIVEAAGQAGYDLSPMKDLLRSLSKR